jgi:hypothetical protein
MIGKGKNPIEELDIEEASWEAEQIQKQETVHHGAYV